jgi:hypothetical protein
VRIKREGCVPDPDHQDVTVEAGKTARARFTVRPISTSSPKSYHNALDGQDPPWPEEPWLRYVGGALQLTDSGKKCVGSFQDGVFSVEVSLGKDAVPNGFGLVFRQREDQAYALLVKGKGEWRLVRLQGMTPKDELRPWRPFPIKDGWNTLRVECRGSSVKVLLNGKKVGDVPGVDPSPGGVGVCSTSRADVAFRDLDVRPLGPD